MSSASDYLSISPAGKFNIKQSNFKGNDVNEADNKASTDEGMKKSTKLMIGASALATAVIAGLAIKKGLDVKSANKALKEFCEKYDVKDLDAKTFKNCQKHFKKVVGYQNLTYEEIAEKAVNVKSKGDLPEDATFNIIRGKQLKDLYTQFTGKKDVKLPENALFLSVTANNNKNVYYSELAIPKTIDKDLSNLIAADEIICLK